MPRHIVIAGAGIAGLTAALALAGHGFRVSVFERASKIEQIGAGLQLSPNATRLLQRLGVLDQILEIALRPEAVVLHDGLSTAELARIPLGDFAQARWRAPYLVLHRAALQKVLLERAGKEARIAVCLGTALPSTPPASGLLVGADGIHSSVRSRIDGAGNPGFAQETAWRAMLPIGGDAGRFLTGRDARTVVSAFLRPGFHLIAYPMPTTGAVNLVAFTKGALTGDEPVSDAALKHALASCAPALRALASLEWSAWPIHTVDRRGRWTAPSGVALIGDAAHAMTPYAAQGAAMAVEDAVTLADAVAALPQDLPQALVQWERIRKPRIERVAKRAALNRFAWHAAGPAAVARNVVLKFRGSEKLAADLDWLYGWDSSA